MDYGYTGEEWGQTNERVTGWEQYDERTKKEHEFGGLMGDKRHGWTGRIVDEQLRHRKRYKQIGKYWLQSHNCYVKVYESFDGK